MATNKSTLMRTDRQKINDVRDLAVYTEYNRLMSVAGQSKTQVNKYLMAKFDLKSETTVYKMRRRAAELLKSLQQ